MWCGCGTRKELREADGGHALAVSGPGSTAEACAWARLRTILACSPWGLRFTSDLATAARRERMFLVHVRLPFFFEAASCVDWAEVIGLRAMGSSARFSSWG